MVVITIDGAYVAYDATSDVTVATTVNGADAAWQEAVAVGSPSPRAGLLGPLYGPLAGPVG